MFNDISFIQQKKLLVYVDMANHTVFFNVSDFFKIFITYTKNLYISEAKKIRELQIL
jgi:hypothetical protein